MLIKGEDNMCSNTNNWQTVSAQTKLSWSIAMERQMRNRDYLMELKTDNLLLHFRSEAGLAGLLNHTLKDVHGGWDAPLSQIRGTFTGHWLSAAAQIYQETGDQELKLKADYIVSEIKRCQEANGGEWLFSIPEKYLLTLKKGGRFWAPHYVCHKIMMGLLDMYLYTGNVDALPMISKTADWFIRFTEDIKRETMDWMMDVEETGGLMELWANMYGVTGDERYKTLMQRYERPSLMNPLVAGKDVTTNMHANSQIPEVHGMARAYEVTGEEKYKQAVEEFWHQTVTTRGAFATGSQTCGEVWTPAGRQLSRLGETNQEHCVVYNMVRLADYLFRWTGEAVYADYIEKNIWNGFFTQGFWQGRAQDSLAEYEAQTGLISYYLPLASGSQKKWGHKTQDFWCCHCTLVQANAMYRQFLMYQNADEIKITQYFPFETKTKINDVALDLKLEVLDDGGAIIKINETALTGFKRPDTMDVKLTIKPETHFTGTISFRIPWWAKGDMTYESTSEFTTSARNGFLQLTGAFNGEVETTVTIKIPRGMTRWPLADAPEYNAFLDGPVLLAGITDEERTLYEKADRELLVPREERKWSNWQNQYQTTGQPINFTFKPLYDVGHEKYTIYFPIERKV